MDYKMDEIGKRIKFERKKIGLSQDELLERLKNDFGIAMNRKSLSGIENGKQPGRDLRLDFVFALCKIFDCEMGYLLGEYDCRTGRITDIQKETRLSEKAVIRLLEEDENEIVVLNCLLEEDRINQIYEVLVESRDKISMMTFIHGRDSKEMRLKLYSELTPNAGRIILQMLDNKDIHDHIMNRLDIINSVMEKIIPHD